jgi:hypothetical protein
MRALHGNLATMETDLPLFCPSGGRCGRRHDYAARQRTVLRVIAKHLLDRSIPAVRQKRSKELLR